MSNVLRRPLGYLVLSAVLLAATSAVGCGGKPPPPPPKTPLKDWVNGWSDDAARGLRKPPKFDIPAPPTAVVLPTAATQIGDDVARAEPALTSLRADVWNEGTQTAAEHTQAALCQWFGWYVEDPVSRPVPGSDAFLAPFVAGALEVELGAPPSQQLREAVELFRNAIERGQSLAEDARLGAMAAACSVPLA